jgi:ribosome-binding protein aMBF1 (putative translation factor)
MCLLCVKREKLHEGGEKMLTIQIRLVFPEDEAEPVPIELEKTEKTAGENHASRQHHLKHERQLRGWSQADLAARIGSVPKTVGRWERGLVFPSPYFQQRLVDLFGKDTEALGLIR